MKAPASIRGTALPETALVVTASLTMVFGIIQIGVIGFMQLVVDGAAFIAAHEYALGNTAYMARVAGPFPQVVATPYLDQNYPDPTTVSVNYNTGASTQRHGGVSLIRSTHLMMTVHKQAPAGLLGVGVAGLSKVDIHGSAIEPQDLVSNDVYDVYGNGYANNSSSQKSFFGTTSAPAGDVQNAPANYISMSEMAVCDAVSFQQACPTASQDVYALGTAEFIDHDNWQRTNLGIGPYSGGYTFGEMLCHQQAFAAAAAFFQPGALQPTKPPATMPYALTHIRSWDYATRTGGGYGSQQLETVYGQYPLHPANGC